MSRLSFFIFFFLMIRRPPRSTLSSSSAASDVYKRQPSMVSVLAVALSCIILVVSIPVQYSMHTSWLHTQLANPNWFFFVNLAHIGGFALGTIMYVKSTLYLLKAVSYTHLRAHETPEHLVCRLLLEKKKN
eukprot:TRINITY_DN56460_c0_g1_i2.p1 TRINITY_DN56460_c0_g1~~TRINITY_DN56460_c0_g1_i2.p1  ORF type:complete len:131 (-),score=34.96 TRINITY_DN56460_c0_g1_i2:98-490(-)